MHLKNLLLYNKYAIYKKIEMFFNKYITSTTTQ